MERGQYIAAMKSSLLTITIIIRCAIDLYYLRQQRHQPHFSDACPGVKRQLHVAIISQRQLRNLNEKQNIFRLRVTSCIAVATSIDETTTSGCGDE